MVISSEPEMTSLSIQACFTSSKPKPQMAFRQNSLKFLKREGKRVGKHLFRSLIVYIDVHQVIKFLTQNYEIN